MSNRKLQRFAKVAWRATNVSTERYQLSEKRIATLSGKGDKEKSNCEYSERDKLVTNITATLSAGCMEMSNCKQRRIF